LYDHEFFEDSSINIDSEECTQESVRKQNRISGRNENVDKKNQKQDGGSIVCNVEVETDENDPIWDDAMPNILNKSQDN